MSKPRRHSRHEQNTGAALKPSPTMIQDSWNDALEILKGHLDEKSLEMFRITYFMGAHAVFFLLWEGLSAAKNIQNDEQREIVIGLFATTLKEELNQFEKQARKTFAAGKKKTS
jgi:hypothetical protein